MRVFEELGRRIRAAWKQADFAESRFTAIACQHLESFAAWRDVGLDDVLTWASSTNRLPVQVESPFGNPITVFHDHQFYIDVLSWLDGTTTIHEHRFVGAFAVLHGSSLHSRYRFHTHEALGERLHLGEIEARGSEILRAGAVRPIHAGREGAHSLFHLDRPSLSIVVRTPTSVVAGPQLSYLAPGIAYDEGFQTPEHRRGERALQLWADCAPDRWLDHAARMIRDADAFAAMRYLRLVGEREASLESCRQLLERCASAHPRLVAAFGPVLDGLRRTRTLQAHRRTIRDAGERRVLGLLLAARGRAELLQLLAELEPGREPLAVLRAWLENVASRREAGSLGVALDDTTVDILCELLAGRSDRQILAALAEAYDDVAPAQLLIDALRTSVLFGHVCGRAEAA